MDNMIKNFKIVMNLAVSDFKKRFVGSYFGIIWMFVQPLATVLVYTLIFQVGFKSVPPVPGVSYVIWLIPGIIPWFYFQDSILQGTQVLYEYNYLVKKIVFNVEMLPLVKLISVFLSHICFVIIMYIVSILMQFGMWMAPIMYDESLFANKAPILIKLIKLNPIYYIVKGYRFCMINDKFVDFNILTLYYWIVTLVIFFMGYKVFNKLKIHFSDVL